jgi:peptidoglycan/xylan/chitin deacetylase (PgdA/CDA1 family)
MWIKKSECLASMIFRLLTLSIWFSGVAFGEPVRYQGGITRGDLSERSVAFVFTGGYHGEGTDYILDILKEKQAPGSFFLTGDYLRNAAFKTGIQRMIEEAHYIGVHSDKHPRYVRSFSSKETLISHREFIEDLERNFAGLNVFGITKSRAIYFIPPYETYNQTIANWAAAYGLVLFNRTSGTLTHGDYTTPSMNPYYSSQTILKSIWAEEKKPSGLNGHLLLIHLGVGPARPDKFYHHLGDLIDQLRTRGYCITNVPTLLNTSKFPEEQQDSFLRQRKQESHIGTI